MKNVTIYELARITGISKSTISRYLNGGYVSLEKSQVIQKAIKDTKFERNEEAVTLRTNKVKALGVILPRIDSYSVSRIVKGIMEIANTHNYTIQFISTNLDNENEIAAYYEFKKRKVSGIISIATIMNEEVESKIRKLGTPVVVVGQETTKIPCVMNDVQKGMMDYLFELLKYKMNKLAIIVPKIEDRVIEKSIKIIFSVLTEKKIQYKLLEADFDWKSGYEVASEAILFSNNILCMTDNIAYGIYKYAKEKNIEVGKELYICGIGGYDTSEILTPELTTIKYSQKEVGVKAAKMLIDVQSEYENNLSYEIRMRDSWKR